MLSRYVTSAIQHFHKTFKYISSLIRYKNIREMLRIFLEQDKFSEQKFENILIIEIISHF